MGKREGGVRRAGVGGWWPLVLRPSGKRDLGAGGATIVVEVVEVMFLIFFSSLDVVWLVGSSRFGELVNLELVVVYLVSTRMEGV